MKRKVKALLALALMLAMVSTMLGDSWLYVSAESSTVTEAEPVSEETEPAKEEAPAAEEQKEEVPAEEAEGPAKEASVLEEEPEKAAEEAQPAEETPAEQPAEETAPASADTGQAKEAPDQVGDQKPSVDAQMPAASEEVPAAETKTTGEENAAKAPETEAQAENENPAAAVDAQTAAEEVPAEVSADESELLTLTEQTIEASVDTEEGNVVITLTGEMPEGVTAKACPAEVSMDGVNVITAYDITLYDADRQEFKPSEEKPLQVKIEDDAVRKALEENAELEVYHLKDAEAEPEQVQDVNLEPAAVEFQAESFSIYVVGTHCTHTYQFLDEDGNLINEQILSAGEKLEEPESPVKDHKKFIGWFDKDGSKFDSFVEEGTLNADAETVLYARYEAVYYVFYKSGSTEDSKVLYTQTYHKEDDKIVTDEVPFAAPSGMALIGWSVNPDATTPNQNLKLAGDDVTLYPVVAAAHWITYDTQGGTILDPTYVLADAVTAEPTAPTKIGYVFAGWFTDAACTEASMFTFGKLLDNDIKLYAKWTPGTATYTVIHWWENADDAGYSYHESEQLEGTTGTDTAAVGKKYSVLGKDIFGQEKTRTDVFNATTIHQETIKGDGSTIVNVYYKRAEYILNFRKGSSDGDVLKSLKKKYGAQISTDEWPEFVYESTGWGPNEQDNSHIAQPNEKNAFGSWKINSTRYLAYSSTMPLENGNLWTYNPGSQRSNAGYYLQNVDDSGYTLDHTDYAVSGVQIGLEDAYEITGFSFEKVGIIKKGSWGGPDTENFYYGNEIKGQKYDGAKFYYTRNEYNIIYHNGVEGHSAPYKFQKSISEAGHYIPASRPAGVDDDYEFVGWYQDPEGTVPYDFSGKTMPANDIIVYAKWKAPEYTVKFELNGATSVDDKYKDQTVEKGKLATQPADPTRDGYTFAGWTKDGSPFSFQTQIIENTTLTAQWISNEKYPLTYVYVFDGKKGTTQADEKSYAVGAEAKVIDIPEGDAWKTPDSMKEFLCWNTEADGSGKDYYPGDSFEMPESVTEKGEFLYTKWVPEREATLTYDLNYEGAGLYGTVTITVPNKPYLIGSDSNDPAKNDPIREGYKFLGWSTEATSAEGEKLLQKNSEIQVDTIKEDTDNILYAQWQKLKEISLNITKKVRGGFGDVNESFNFEYTITGTGVTEKTGTFTLKSGESKLLEHIPEGATVTVTENATEGYTPSYKIGTDAETAGFTCSYTVTDQAENGSKIAVTFFNQKDGVAPTGVATNWMSSVLMLFAGFSMAVVMLFTGKRRKI